MDGFDDGILVQREVQSLGRAAWRQQGLVRVRLLEALHETHPADTQTEPSICAEHLCDSLKHNGRVSHCMHCSKSVCV